MSPYLITRFSDVDIAAPGANTGITGGITPTVGCAIRVTVSLATSSVFNVTVTPDGGTKRTHGLNTSAPLNANDLYSFVFGAAIADASGAALSYDFEVETDGIIRYLVVEEAQVGAP